MNDPLVSVIMPCYNDGRYIRETVESVASQTYRNVELVIIDDGSDDDCTEQIIRDISFPRKKVLHTKHVRPAAARNAGIRAAEGKYILPLDADDTISPEYVKKAVALMEADPEIGIVYCHADLFGEADGPWNLPDYDLKRMLVENCIFVTAVFRKADWERVGGFCTDFVYGLEDYDFWLSLIENGSKVVQLPETLFHYRIKSGSRTSSFDACTGHVQETYDMLFQRHKKLYTDNLELYCMELRKKMVEYLNAFNAYSLIDSESGYYIDKWKNYAKKHPGNASKFLKVLALFRKKSGQTELR